MATFVSVVATTAATTVAAGFTAAPNGVTILNHPSNKADCVIRVSNVSTDITTNGYALSLNQSTLISVAECAATAGGPGNAGAVWLYANTTGQTVCVRY